jgi:ubiquitin thioesterase protein OTUB1
MKEGMFQPQPTPYSPFLSYGAVPDFHSFQPSSTARSGLAVDSGGPIIFRDPIFSPINPNANANNAGASNYNNSNLGPQFKMAANGINDLEQQEELARNFQPDLQVLGPLRGEM